MAKMTMNELKIYIAGIIDEAKKKKEKAEDIKKKGASVEAYGLYDEALDFSAPLGTYNLYAQQGVVNWGPYTSKGTTTDTSFANPNVGPQINESEEQALRAMVREVIENGLVPHDSAWAPMLERTSKSPNNIWEAANNIFEAWYDREKSDKNKPEGKAQGFEKHDDAEAVKKHGFEKKKKR